MWQRCPSLLSWQHCYMLPQVPSQVHTATTALPWPVSALWCHQASFLFVCLCMCVSEGGEELHSDCLAVVQAPTVQVDPQLTLPLDINNYLMTHYIRAIFRVNTQSTYTKHGYLWHIINTQIKGHPWGSSSTTNSRVWVITVCCRSHCLECWQPHWRVRSFGWMTSRNKELWTPSVWYMWHNNAGNHTRHQQINISCSLITLVMKRELSQKAKLLIFSLTLSHKNKVTDTSGWHGFSLQVGWGFA